MTNANVFPVDGAADVRHRRGIRSIDHMLGKAADFYEPEVDEMVVGACPASWSHHHRVLGT